MKTIALKIITPSKIKEKILSKEKIIIYFNKNTFSYFKDVQRIFFKNKIGWNSSGTEFLNLELRGNYLALYFNGEVLTFDDTSVFGYDDMDEIYEEYMFFPTKIKSKLSI